VNNFAITSPTVAPPSHNIMHNFFKPDKTTACFIGRIENFPFYSVKKGQITDFSNTLAVRLMYVQKTCDNIFQNLLLCMQSILQNMFVY